MRVTHLWIQIDDQRITFSVQVHDWRNKTIFFVCILPWNPILSRLNFSIYQRSLFMFVWNDKYACCFLALLITGAALIYVQRLPFAHQFGTTKKLFIIEINIIFPKILQKHTSGWSQIWTERLFATDGITTQNARGSQQPLLSTVSSFLNQVFA